MAKSINPTMQGSSPASPFGTFSAARSLAQPQQNSIMGNLGIYAQQQKQQPAIGDGIYFANGNSLYQFSPNSYLNSMLNPAQQWQQNYTPSNSPQLAEAMMMQGNIPFRPQRPAAPTPRGNWSQMGNAMFDKAGAAKHYLGNAK